MFVSKNQYAVFICSVFIGGLCGIIGDAFKPIKIKINRSVFRHFIDVLIFLLYTLIFIVVSNIYKFPNFRAYMLGGFFIGKTIYNKSLGIILAKSVKKIYNKLRVEIIKRRKKTNDGEQV